MLVAVTAWLAPTPAAADEPVPPDVSDPGAYPPPTARWRLFGVGAAATAVWYGGAVGLSYAWPSAPRASDLRIPIAGPWLALSATGCPASDPDCSTFIVVLRAVLTGIDGVGQVGGLAAMAEAVFMPTAGPIGQATARRAPTTSAPTEDADRVFVQVRPFTMVGKDNLGVGLWGRF